MEGLGVGGEQLKLFTVEMVYLPLGTKFIQEEFKIGDNMGGVDGVFALYIGVIIIATAIVWLG